MFLERHSEICCFSLTQIHDMVRDTMRLTQKCLTLSHWAASAILGQGKRSQCPVKTTTFISTTARRARYGVMTQRPKRHIPVLDSVVHGPWCHEVSIYEETLSTVERHQRTIDCPFVECVSSMDEIVRMTLIHQQDHLLIKCHKKRAEPSNPIDEHTPKPIVHETTPTAVSV